MNGLLNPIIMSCPMIMIAKSQKGIFNPQDLPGHSGKRTQEGTKSKKRPYFETTGNQT